MVFGSLFKTIFKTNASSLDYEALVDDYSGPVASERDRGQNIDCRFGASRHPEWLRVDRHGKAEMTKVRCHLDSCGHAFISLGDVK